MKTANAVVMSLAIAFSPASKAFSPSCTFGLKDCATILGVSMPVDDALRIVDECRDFTRANIGARVLRMSFVEIEKVAGRNWNHPLIRALGAYEYLHDSSLKFDRSLPIERRYASVRYACGHAFRAMRVPVSEEQ